MLTSNIVGVIADDLTGANDTALQFFTKGAVTEIILDYNHLPGRNLRVNTWATSTESRNIPSDDAYKRTYDACMSFKNNLNVEFFYKKIDSTMRGNIAQEILAVLDATEKDCAIIAPAFVQEGRFTLGGYQLLRGIPIERTEAARDPHTPVCESNIVSILQKQLGKEKENILGLIEFSTVAKGAAPLTVKLNELIKNGKKLIVIDALSTVDVEQIVLAMKKSNYDILPCGSAGLAQALASDWLEEASNQHIKKRIPSLPKLVLSGSATQLSALQIKKLQFDDDIENAYFISLKTADILDGLKPEIIKRVLANLIKTNIVVVHVGELSVEIEENNSEAKERLIDEGVTKEQLAHKITEYLAKLTREVKQQRDFIALTVGGETSFKCCEALFCEHLQVVDTILPSIPLCLGSNAQFVVTKSGNLGTSNTLIEIMKYFEQHE